MFHVGRKYILHPPEIMISHGIDHGEHLAPNIYILLFNCFLCKVLSSREVLAKYSTCNNQYSFVTSNGPNPSPDALYLK